MAPKCQSSMLNTSKEIAILTMIFVHGDQVEEFDTHHGVIQAHQMTLPAQSTSVLHGSALLHPP